MGKLTEFAEEYLLKHHKDQTCSEMAKALELHTYLVRARAIALGLTPKSERADWQPEEDEYLYSHVKKTPITAIAKTLGRTKNAIATRCRAIGLEYSTQKKWTQADDKYLFERHKEKFVKDIAETLGFSVPAVESRLKQLNLTGLYDEKQWTQKEDLFLIKNHLLMSVKEMAAALGFSSKTIYRNLSRLKLKTKSSAARQEKKNQKGSGPERLWRPFEDAYIMEYYSKKDKREMAKRLSCSMEELGSRCAFLHVPEYQASHFEDDDIHKKWSVLEDSYLRNNLNKKRDEQMALDLRRTTEAIKNRLRKLGLKRERASAAPPPPAPVTRPVSRRKRRKLSRD